jgi:hypothetical protein
MPNRKPPKRGRRGNNWPVRGGRRRTDPPAPGARVAVIPDAGAAARTADGARKSRKADDGVKNLEQIVREHLHQR